MRMHHSQTDFTPEEKQPTERCSKGSHFLKSCSKLHHDTFPRPPPPPPGKANLLHRFLSQKSDLPWEKPDFECKNGCPQGRRVKPHSQGPCFQQPPVAASLPGLTHSPIKREPPCTRPGQGNSCAPLFLHPTSALASFLPVLT